MPPIGTRADMNWRDRWVMERERGTRSSRRWRTPASADSAAPAFRRAASGRSVAAGPGPRLMAINIDEGEPGTFKDRFYLERDPHRFLDGALIAAWAVDIAEIYIYLRDEYHGCREILENEIAGLAGEPAVPDPAHSSAPWRGRLHLRRRIRDDRIDRGKRGAPRLRPPYVAQVGLFGRPTLEQTWRRCTGCATSSRRAGLVWRSWSAWTKGPPLVLGERTRQEARRAPRGCRDHGRGVDRRVLRRDARRSRFYGYLPGARPAASCRRRWPTSLSISTP